VELVRSMCDERGWKHPSNVHDFVRIWSVNVEERGSTERHGGPGRPGWWIGNESLLYPLIAELRQAQASFRPALDTLQTPLCLAFKEAYPDINNEKLRRGLRAVDPAFKLKVVYVKKEILAARKVMRERIGKERLAITDWSCFFIFDETSVRFSKMAGGAFRVVLFEDEEGYEEAQTAIEDPRLPHDSSKDIKINLLGMLSPLRGAGPLTWLSGTTELPTEYKVRGKGRGNECTTR